MEWHDNYFIQCFFTDILLHKNQLKTIKLIESNMHRIAVTELSTYSSNIFKSTYII